jgi:hypothetical protein
LLDCGGFVACRGYYYNKLPLVNISLIEKVKIADIVQIYEQTDDQTKGKKGNLMTPKLLSFTTKKQTKVINGVKWYRFKNDTLWQKEEK